uniref:Probable E3 ubiquitin-protein ligase ARI8 n=1 Tax=Oryzias melastigma TaxID=30732 RepID=A0A3B3C6C5_ORYME
MCSRCSYDADSATGGTETMVIQVIVNTFEGQKITVDLCQDEKQLQLMTVLQLKQKIALKLPGRAERMAADMQLIFADKRLDQDSKLLCEFGILHRSLIQMVMSLDGGRGV